MNQLSHRRNFMRAFGAAASLSVFPSILADQPEVTNPRATDGDESHQPNWSEQLSITVGQTGKADLVGNSDRVIQAAIDYLQKYGGGTVNILPGTYVLRNAIHLSSKTRLVGNGEDTVLTKIPSETVAISAESDWYEQEITLAKNAGFRVGDGVLLEAKNPHHGGAQVIKRTLVARSGNRFKLNDGLRSNLWLSGNPQCSSLFPLLTAERQSDVVIESLTLDGNRENNRNLNGNYGGCIFLQDCNRFSIRNVETRNYNGDGISFQICHDVVVEDCYSHHNANLGVHPGSGSQRPLIRANRLEKNNLGLFWCWGVKYGLAEENQIDGNLSYGISIGHNDTDNVMRNNVISNSGKVGILFRNESRGQDFWPHRNRVENNQIINSGADNGIAIDIQGKTNSTQIVGNEFQENRKPSRRVGIRIGEEVGEVKMSNNRFTGFSQDLIDQRTS